VARPLPAVDAGSPEGEDVMASCEVCGNSYDKSFKVVAAGGQEHVFDSFECAVHALAPRCDHCGCRILGHGMEVPAAKKVYCCAHCAHQAGHGELKDRA
jgi:hypothetical protein